MKPRSLVMTRATFSDTFGVRVRPLPDAMGMTTLPATGA